MKEKFHLLGSAKCTRRDNNRQDAEGKPRLNSTNQAWLLVSQIGNKTRASATCDQIWLLSSSLEKNDLKNNHVVYFGIFSSLLCECVDQSVKLLPHGLADSAKSSKKLGSSQENA